MAPMARNRQSPVQSRLLSADDAYSRPTSQNGSWENGGSQGRFSTSREPSEEPDSYEEYSDADYRQNGMTEYQQPELHDDILHPLREAADRVGRQVEEFAQILDKYNPRTTDDPLERHEMVFDMVDSFHRIALDTLQELKSTREPKGIDAKDTGMKNSGMRGFLNKDLEDDMDLDEEEPLELLPAHTATDEDLGHWQDECHTWDLFKRMLQFRYPIPGALKPQPEPIHQYSTETQLYRHYIATDDRAYERSIVLRWLKDIADESSPSIDHLVKDLQQQADRGDIVTHGWIHTKGTIKLQKRINTWSTVMDPEASEVQRLQKTSKAATIITQLDPDAPVRQNRNLEAQDDSFEQAIWLGCYELLRRGKSLAEVKEWCGERTEVWRAVSMSGLVDLDYDILESEVDDKDGYISTGLWRKTCHALAQRSQASPWERAVYGLLSGDVDSMEGVIKGWNCRLFATYNALLRTGFESFVKKNGFSNSSTAKLPVFDALQSLGGEQDDANHGILKSLLRNARFDTDATSPMKLLQGAILSNQILDFTLQQGLAYSKEGGDSSLMRRIHAEPDYAYTRKYLQIEDHDSMRVLTHIFLILRGLGQDSHADDETNYAMENIVACYINFLRLSGKEEIIPLYTAQLSEDRCYDILSRTMIDVTDPDARDVQIYNMHNFGLDAQRFVRLQTTNLLEEFPLQDATKFELKMVLPRNESESTESIPIPTGRGSQKMQGESERCRIDLAIFDQPIDRADLLLIRSLDWHMLVPGLWSVTYRTGADLYKRFLSQGKLSAAKHLHNTLSANEISLNKTDKLLGSSIPVEDLKDDYPITEIMDADELEAVKRRNLLMRHMLAEASSYVDLEKLVTAMDMLHEAGSLVVQYNTTRDVPLRKNVRAKLHPTLVELRPVMGCLFAPDFLTKSVVPEPVFTQIRASYLPEIILAFQHVLHSAGSMISRDNLLECLNLSTYVADEKNDLAELFIQKGKLKGFLRGFADDSLALLVSMGGGRPEGNCGKMLHGLGWRRDIWKCHGVAEVDEGDEEQEHGAVENQLNGH